MSGNDTTEALMTVIKALTPLNSEERRRTVDAAMLFLGEKPVPAAVESPVGSASEAVVDGTYPAGAVDWMKQHAVSAAQLDRVFHFNGDGTFDLLDAPGKSKREKTLNTYILTGLGNFLVKKERSFDDATARAFCEAIGCYDAANHAATLKEKGAEFSGDKTKGYSLTNVGVKSGADLVKELAGIEK